MMSNFVKELSDLFTGWVLTDMENRKIYSADKCPGNLFKEVSPCLAVVSPSRAGYKEELPRLINLAKKYGKKIVVRGGGSGVCGAIVPHNPQNTVIVDIGSLNFISTLNLFGGYVVVGAGILGSKLEGLLNNHFRVTTGHSPASLEISTPGGWVATRSSGQFSSRYGTIEDIALGVEAVTADGKISWFEGDDLKYFFRMEGTTGIITKVKMKIFPLCDYRKFMCFSFDCFKNAVDALEYLFYVRNSLEKHGVFISVARLYDWFDYNFISKPHKEPIVTKGNKGFLWEKLLVANPFLTNFLAGFFKESTMLLVLESDDNNKIKKVEEELTFLLEDGFESQNIGGEVAENWYNDRYKLNWGKLEEKLKKGVIVDTFDCKPKNFKSALEIYEVIKRELKRKAVVGAHFGLDREGSYIYFTFAAAASSKKKLELYNEIWGKILSFKLWDTQGMTTHHHGIGKLKAGTENEYSCSAYGSDWFYGVATSAKVKLDPDNIFNPGKIFPPRHFYGASISDK